MPIFWGVAFGWELATGYPWGFWQSGMNEMRNGRSATVRRGSYAGDELSVDHIIPRTVVPELDNVIANLELLPQRANS